MSAWVDDNLFNKRRETFKTQPEFTYSVHLTLADHIGNDCLYLVNLKGLVFYSFGSDTLNETKKTDQFAES